MQCVCTVFSCGMDADKLPMGYCPVLCWRSSCGLLLSERDENRNHLVFVQWAPATYSSLPRWSELTARLYWHSVTSRIFGVSAASLPNKQVPFGPLIPLSAGAPWKLPKPLNRPTYNFEMFVWLFSCWIIIFSFFSWFQAGLCPGWGGIYVSRVIKTFIVARR